MENLQVRELTLPGKGRDFNKIPGDVKEITLVLDVLENVFMDTTKEIFS